MKCPKCNVKMITITATLLGQYVVFPLCPTCDKNALIDIDKRIKRQPKKKHLKPGW